MTNYLPEWLYHFAISPTMNKSSHCSASLSALGVVSVLDFGCTNGYVVVSHCCLNLHFPDDVWCVTSFHMCICHLYVFFDEVSVQAFGPFFNWFVHFLIVGFKSSFYILNKSPLSNMSFANIFSQSMACLLILLMLYFGQQRFFILMKSRVSIISFMDCAFDAVL